MSVIYPGNYVTALNAYRDQGVYALPGVEFYQVRGAAIVTSDLSGSDSLEVKVLSPDLRQDDKPRLDKALVVPQGATVYRTAVNPVNLSTVAANSVSVAGPSTGGILAQAVAQDGVFPEAGGTSDFAFTTTLSAETGDVTVSVDRTAELNIVDPADQAAVLVEICYFIPSKAPTTDDVSLPYKTEAGSGY